jgi:hypothetical protein
VISPLRGRKGASVVCDHAPARGTARRGRVCDHAPMVERDEAALIAYVAQNASTVKLALRDSPDLDRAVAALAAAGTAVRAIPHPEEPTEPLPNWVDVSVEHDVPLLRLDLKDERGSARLVVRTILGALDASGVTGRLAPMRVDPEKYRYDPEADILGGADWIEELDERGLPPVFPAGFPVPEGTLVIRQQARNDTWQHGAWRRDRPYDDYPEQLRAFGCTLELVTAQDRLMRSSGMTRHLLRHPLGTGSVSTYHEYEPRGGFGRRAPRRWYVSVVWKPPATP